MSGEATRGARQSGELALQRGWSLEAHSSRLSVPVCLEQVAVRQPVRRSVDSKHRGRG